MIRPLLAKNHYTSRVNNRAVQLCPGASIIDQQVRSGCHTTLCSFIPSANEPQHEPGYLQPKLQ